MSIEVCKLVVEFLSKNQNINRYTAIAEKMNTSKENLELTVQALTLLIIKSIQNNVNYFFTLPNFIANFIYYAGYENRL